MNLTTENCSIPSLCWERKSDDDVIEYILSLSEQLRRTTTGPHWANGKDKHLEMIKQIKKQQEMLALGVMLFGTVEQLNVSMLRTAYKKLIVRIHPDKNHHVHAHDVFQIVHTCFEYMQERIKLKEEYLKQKESYSVTKESQERTVPLFAHSRCMNMTKYNKNISLHNGSKSRVFHNLMQSQSYPFTANVNKTATTMKKTSRMPANHVPYSFSQTHVSLLSSSRVRDRMEHSQVNNNGVNQTHINHTMPPTFTHAASSSHLFMCEHVENAESNRQKVPHTSQTHNMYVSKKMFYPTGQVNHVNSSNTFAKHKQKNFIINEENTLESHLHCNHHFNAYQNDSKNYHVGTNVTCANSNIISSVSNNNRGKWEVHHSEFQINDNNHNSKSKRNWLEVEQWARHILDSESDNDSKSLSMCNESSDSTDNPIIREDINSGNSSSSSSSSNSSEDMWGEMQNTYNDEHSEQLSHIRHTKRTIYNKHNFHKHRMFLPSSMCNEPLDSLSWGDNNCDYNKHHSVDWEYLTSSSDDRFNENERNKIRENDSGSYIISKHSVHSDLSFCSELTFSSELSSPSHYSSHSIHTSSLSSSSGSSSPFS